VGGGRAARVPVDRASPADLMQLAVDVGPAPMHMGAVLVLGTGPGFGVQEAQRLLGERVHAVPRLRQRLRRAPPGCGRPFWADDPAFDLRHHIRQLPCPPPGDVRALLTLAADAWAGRARGLTHLARSVRTLRQGLAELGGARPPRRLPATSLNRPTGPQRRLDVVAADLAAVRDLGHAHGGTVNDVILAAIAGALRALLASRGEQLDLVAASVPVSARRAAIDGELGTLWGARSLPGL
jgi:Wax ester synthase-like Acyl-CoA acyltransferase domain